MTVFDVFLIFVSELANVPFLNCFAQAFIEVSADYT